MGYDPLIRAFDRHSRENLIVKWESGLKLAGKLDTISETDNGLEDDDEGFQEYIAAIVKLEYIIHPPLTKDDELFRWIQQHELFETSLYSNTPKRISLEDETVIWQDSESS
ncbi:hypothetical protein [Priestia endophytica]|uniref:hypothetical protein n=1 Tax=Priestia endophytica TaxID=135735 RepID=UPI00227F43CE|nr:hypothetical protein [Priestia endophytica]MCY8235108.1 hypothetical protein [Priestia endophytica]